LFLCDAKTPDRKIAAYKESIGHLESLTHQARSPIDEANGYADIQLSGSGKKMRPELITCHMTSGAGFIRTSFAASY